MNREPEHSRVLRSDDSVLEVIVHRSYYEIGGNLIELVYRPEEGEASRLLLDAGLPLASDDPDDESLPESFTAEPREELLSLVISHAHPDHYGLHDELPEGLPRLVTDETGEILRGMLRYRGKELHGAIEPVLEAGTTFEAGPFRLTPRKVDHSVYGAVALEIRVNGLHLLYTGDLRNHGKLGVLVDELAQELSGELDLLITEGTPLPAPEGDERIKSPKITEASLEPRFQRVMEETDGLVMAWYASINIDRLVNLHNAAKKAGREFLVDLSTACVLDEISRDTIPHPEWSGVGVFVPKYQKCWIKRRKDFDTINRFRPYRVFPEELQESPGDYLITFKSKAAEEIIDLDLARDSSLIYSLWSGYLDEDWAAEPVEMLESHGTEVLQIHTSGHLSKFDLRNFRETIDAEEELVIHTDMRKKA